jgi:hypothetical protein
MARGAAVMAGLRSRGAWADGDVIAGCLLSTNLFHFETGPNRIGTMFAPERPLAGRFASRVPDLAPGVVARGVLRGGRRRPHARIDTCPPLTMRA